MTTTRNVLDEVLAERKRQDAKWGEQSHPMIPAEIEREARAHNTVPAFFACHVLGIDDAKAARDECERAHRLGYGTYTHILIEELAEFIEACVKHGEASDEAWGELVQTVAVGVAMLEALARRRGHRAEEPQQEHDALRAQLAQVTAERDALRRALAAAATGKMPRCETCGDRLATRQWSGTLNDPCGVCDRCFREEQRSEADVGNELDEEACADLPHAAVLRDAIGGAK